jgi:hypothetical protein
MTWSICSLLAVDLVASGAMLEDARRLATDPVGHPTRARRSIADDPRFRFLLLPRRSPDPKHAQVQFR